MCAGQRLVAVNLPDEFQDGRRVFARIEIAQDVADNTFFVDNKRGAVNTGTSRTID
jgi:hypothetical protein